MAVDEVASDVLQIMEPIRQASSAWYRMQVPLSYILIPRVREGE